MKISDWVKDDVSTQSIFNERYDRDKHGVPSTTKVPEPTIERSQIVKHQAALESHLAGLWLKRYSSKTVAEEEDLVKIRATFQS